MAKNKQIIYGTSHIALIDFANNSKLIAMTDMQDLEISTSVDFEDITGGNKIFPIASFPTNKGITVSGTNATFKGAMMEYLEGSDAKIGSIEFPVVKELAIPANGELVLDETPVEGSVLVEGFTLATETPTTGQYMMATDTKTITFATEDAGKVVGIRYNYMSSESAVEYAITPKTMVKPFRFEAVFDIYDEDTQITHKGAIIVYKMQCTSGFQYSGSHQTAFAPQFEASAKDPQRNDGKMWSLLIDGVAVA